MLQDHRRWRTPPGAFSMPAVAADDDAGPLALPMPCTAAGPLPGGAPGGGRLVGFGPVAGLEPARLLAELRIGGVSPEALTRVELRSRDRLVYRLDSVCDARGLPLPAGELLLAMARMQGRSAMVIDATGLDLAPASTVVWLTLAGAAGDSLPQVSLVLADAAAQSAS